MLVSQVYWTRCSNGVSPCLKGIIKGAVSPWWNKMAKEYHCVFDNLGQSPIPWVFDWIVTLKVAWKPQGVLYRRVKCHATNLKITATSEGRKQTPTCVQIPLKKQSMNSLHTATRNLPANYLMVQESKATTNTQEPQNRSDQHFQNCLAAKWKILFWKQRCFPRTTRGGLAVKHPEGTADPTQHIWMGFFRSRQTSLFRNLLIIGLNPAAWEQAGFIYEKSEIIKAQQTAGAACFCLFCSTTMQ